MSPPLNMKIILLSAVAGVAALAVMATAQKTVLDHDKVVSCYVGTWAFYR